MFDLILEAIFWAILGGLLGFYIFYARGYNTRTGLWIGAVLSIVIGVGGTELGVVSSPLSAVVVTAGLLGVLMLFLPDIMPDTSTTVTSESKAATNQRKLFTALGGVAIILFLLVGISQAFFDYTIEIAVALIVLGFIYVAYSMRDTEQFAASIDRSTAIMLFAIGFIAIVFALAVPTIAPMLIILAGIGVFIFLIPSGDYDNQQSKKQRVSNLAYALLIPTVLIVLGIVIFPVIWNVIFSVRDIEVADLRDVNLLDFRDLTLDNYEAQAGLRIDTVPCEYLEDGTTCAVDEDGNIIYEDARRYFEDYRGWREINGINQGDSRLAVGARNEDFYPMLWRTLWYTFTSTTFAIIFGLIAALIVREEFKGRTVFRGFILFPYIAPVISVAFIWQILLRQSGLVNSVMGTNVDYLGPSGYPLLMVILFQVWRYFPFAFLFLLARIQAIPSDMYEAAKVDGAAPLARLWFITLPQLRAVFGTLFLLRFIWTFNKFDDIFLLTGPITQTKVIPIQIYLALFNESNVGEASAVAVIMAAILAIILLIYFRYFLVDEA